jgi:hypothetical protein
VSGQLHTPAALTLGKKAHGTHWIEGCVDTRTGLDDMERRKILPLSRLELQPFGRQSRKKSVIQKVSSDGLLKKQEFISEPFILPFDVIPYTIIRHSFHYY